MRFAGYAAVFDRADLGGDVIRRGAFRVGLDRNVPLLWEHARGKAIGRIEAIEEDAKGLRVIGRIEEARAAGMVREGAVRGLSVGYRVRRARGVGPRELVELELVEVSLVARPMQPLARVVAIERGRDMTPQADFQEG